MLRCQVAVRTTGLLAVPGCSARPALCERGAEELRRPACVHFANSRLRVTEIKLQPGESVSTRYGSPHLRWEALPPGGAETPRPTFHGAGQLHTLRAKPGAEHREYVFEFLVPPKYTQQEFREKQAATWYHGSPGTRCLFENEYCVAHDFRVPAQGGDEHDMHQHTVDHFFVVLDTPCSLDVYVPRSAGELPAADRRVRNVRRAGKLECRDAPTSWRYYPEEGDAGFVGGVPALGPAVHGVRNPGARELREYYVDLK